MSTSEHAQVILYALPQSDKECVTDEGVADRHFRQVRELAKDNQVVQIEIVSCIDAKAERVRQLCGPGVPLELYSSLTLTARKRSRKRLGIELHAIPAKRRRPAHGGFLRVDEQAHSDSCGSEVSNDLSNGLPRGVRRPSRLTGHLSRTNRNERALVRLDAMHQFQQIRPRAGQGGHRLRSRLLKERPRAGKRAGQTVRLQPSTKDVSRV